MSISVTIIDGPLPPRPHAEPPIGAGAVVVFEGVVRPDEAGRRIEALNYEAYQPMAERVLERIGSELVAKHRLISLAVEHSRGRVGVGECSFRLTICSPHRKEALAAMDEFIDRLKQDVPIWKAAPPGAPTAP